MAITIMLLLVTAACTWPGLISPRREAGLKLLRALMLPQGAAGVVLLLAAAASAAVLAVFPDTVGVAGANAALARLTLALANGAAFGAGVVLSFGLIVRLASRRSSAEVVARTEGKYLELAGFFPALGLLCLVLAGWCLLLAAAVPPLPSVPAGEAG